MVPDVRLSPHRVKAFAFFETPGTRARAKKSDNSWPGYDQGARFLKGSVLGLCP